MTSVSGSNFDQHWKNLGQEMLPKLVQNNMLLESRLEMENCVSNAPTRADRGSEPSEKHRKREKKCSTDQFSAMLDFELFEVPSRTSFWSL